MITFLFGSCIKTILYKGFMGNKIFNERKKNVPKKVEIYKNIN